jgi:hypothetical protein
MRMRMRMRIRVRVRVRVRVGMRVRVTMGVSSCHSPRDNLKTAQSLCIVFVYRKIQK